MGGAHAPEGGSQRRGCMCLREAGLAGCTRLREALKHRGDVATRIDGLQGSCSEGYHEGSLFSMHAASHPSSDMVLTLHSHIRTEPT